MKLTCLHVHVHVVFIILLNIYTQVEEKKKILFSLILQCISQLRTLKKQMEYTNRNMLVYMYMDKLKTPTCFTVNDMKYYSFCGHVRMLWPLVLHLLQVTDHFGVRLNFPCRICSLCCLERICARADGPKFVDL